MSTDSSASETPTFSKRRIFLVVRKREGAALSRSIDLVDLSLIAPATLQALELMRQIVYGYDPATARLQRVLEIAQRETG